MGIHVKERTGKLLFAYTHMGIIIFSFLMKYLRFVLHYVECMQNGKKNKKHPGSGVYVGHNCLNDRVQIKMVKADRKCINSLYTIVVTIKASQNTYLITLRLTNYNKSSTFHVSKFKKKIVWFF